MAFSVISAVNITKQKKAMSSKTGSADFLKHASLISSPNRANRVTMVMIVVIDQ